MPLFILTGGKNTFDKTQPIEDWLQIEYKRRWDLKLERN